MRPRRAVWVAAVLCVVAGAATAGAQAQATLAPTLPARLTDQEFWAFVTDASEPNGMFPSDNLLSNESTYQYVIPALQQRTKPGGVYLGVGPEQNFTYITAIRPRMAVIIDIRRGNLLLHLLYKSLFELSADRADFVARLYSRPRPPRLDTASTVAMLFAAFDTIRPDSARHRLDVAAVRDHLMKDHGFALSPDDVDGMQYVYDAFYQAGPGLDYNYGNANRGGFGGRPTYAGLMQADDGHGVQRSYLATEANYRFIKTMEANNMIVPLVGDFAGPKSIVAVGKYLREHHTTATAFYTSNVEQYLFQQFDDWSKFYTNVAALPIDSTSTFIRAVFASARVIPGLGGNSSVTLLSSIGGLLTAFKAGALRGYLDVVMLSR
jgi:hypothetical protein